MIRGDFHFHPDFSSTQGLPFWRAMPWVDAEIKIPGLAVEGLVTMMVDTGADFTALHVRDSWRILDKRGYRLLRQFTSRDSTGVGGLLPILKFPLKLFFNMRTACSKALILSFR